MNAETRIVTGVAPRAQNGYTRLKQEIAALRAEIITLAAERDDLVTHVCRDLKAQYDSRIGVLEWQVLTAKVRVQVLRRTVEILQAARNRGEMEDPLEAAAGAQAEYQPFEEDLRRKADDIRRAKAYRQSAEEKERAWQQEREQQKQRRTQTDAKAGESAAADDTPPNDSAAAGPQSAAPDEAEAYTSRSDELKKLYRRIVKRLHPDVNSDQTEAERHLFREATEAYQNDDLDRLREIAAMLDDGIEDYENTPEDIAKMRQLRDELKERRDALRSEIEEIKSSFPYTLKEFLEDDDAVAARQQELAQQLAACEEQAEKLQERIKKMERGEEL